MPKDIWRDDSIQFPRLLAEIMAVGLTDEQCNNLETSMDIDQDQLLELFDRAQTEWEEIKKKYCPIRP
jgi:hypothetical protein